MLILTAFLPGRSVNSITNRFGFRARHLNGANTVMDPHPIDAAPLRGPYLGGESPREYDII
jgi:hypothetical protein